MSAERGRSVGLRRRAASEVAALPRAAIAPETLAQAAAIVEDVRRRGEAAMREHGERFGDLRPGEPLIAGPEELGRALGRIGAPDRHLIERTAERIRAFAAAQREHLQEFERPVPGGVAGIRYLPLERVGCYAPGGRFPLPSSVLMTAITARVAGVREVVVASPRPAPITLAAAAVAGADAVLRLGGAQAVAALAFGVGGLSPCDAVVGPGNRFVTAAKQLVVGRVAIDMLAGPSELLILADASADPALCAADLLAQAEHDPDAVPILLSLDSGLCDAVDLALAEQLRELREPRVARQALENGFAVVAADLEQALALCERIAPEHLELHLADAAAVAPRLRAYGALFVGPWAAEVLGDYGAGPNHVLPTGGTARFSPGLSVLTFLTPRAWLRIDDPEPARQLCADAAHLARLEGLEAHERAARRRL